MAQQYLLPKKAMRFEPSCKGKLNNQILIGFDSHQFIRTPLNLLSVVITAAVASESLHSWREMPSSCLRARHGRKPQ